jgi:hypothetical protein
MARFRVQFRTCIQDSQDAQAENPSDDHLISRVIFDLAINGRLYRSLYVDVRQPFGTNYIEEPLEVGPPHGDYRGPFPHAQFSEAVEKYYRSLFGPEGAFCFAADGATRHFANNIMLVSSGPFDFDFDVPDATGGWQLGANEVVHSAVSRPTSVQRVEGQTFDGQDVTLEGHYYVDCTFLNNCRFIFSGIAVGGIDASCKLQHPFSLGLVGPAQATVLFLRHMYHGLPDLGPILVEKFIEDIRKPPETGT